MDSTLAAPAAAAPSIDVGTSTGAGSTNAVDATPSPNSGFAPALSNALRALRSQAHATASDGTAATTQPVAPLVVGLDEVENNLDVSEVDQDQGTVQQGLAALLGSAVKVLLTPAPVAGPIGQHPVVAAAVDLPNAELAMPVQSATATVPDGDVQPPLVPGTAVPAESVVATAQAPIATATPSADADVSPLTSAVLDASSEAPPPHRIGKVNEQQARPRVRTRHGGAHD